MMKRLIYLTFFSISLLTLNAQQMQGIWEGSLFLNGNAKTTMKIRIEIVEQDNSYFGILYSRGVEKNTVYGCDYIVTGFKTKNILNLKWQKVQRSVAMSENDCRKFEQLILTVKQKEATQILEGSWVWEDGREDVISCVKAGDAISDMAADEIEIYLNNVYELYEKMEIILSLKDRFPKKEFNLEVDISDVVIEFSTIDSGKHDSISVYFNGNAIAQSQYLFQKPLRLRLKELPPGSNDLLVVSQSLVQSKLNIQMKIIHRGQISLVTIHPGFTVNTLVLFKGKEE